MQGTLDFSERLEPVELPCAFGHLSDPLCRHHCVACEADVERACAVFAAAVARGEYDSEGYTPNERKRLSRAAKVA